MSDFIVNKFNLSDKNFNKIFGIGLSKTGTASLAYALRLLGISCLHYPINRETIKTSDAIVDGLVAVDFPYYDYYYQGSKFIYTIRSYDEWIASCKIHFEMKLSPEILKNSKEKIHKLFWENMFFVWGTDTFDEKLWKKTYENHQNIIKEYFKNRSEDLLIIDICSGEGWEKICPFLGVSIPKEAFPFENITHNPFKIISKQVEKNVENIIKDKPVVTVNTPQGKILFNKDISKPFYYKKAFSREECEKIINAPEIKIQTEEENKSLKVSKVKFIEKNVETRWIWERIQNYVQLVNLNHYKFKLSHIADVHLMEYQKDCFFKWHIDLNGGEFFALRKISIVIFLSDKNDYQGGNLLFDITDENEIPTIDMEQGSIILFPSFHLHKVSDIKSGVRRTLVAWVYGDSFS